MSKAAAALKILEDGGAFRISSGMYGRPAYSLVDASRKRVKGFGEAALWEVVSTRGLYEVVGCKSVEYRLPRNDREASQLVRKL